MSNTSSGSSEFFLLLFISLLFFLTCCLFQLIFVHHGPVFSKQHMTRMVEQVQRGKEGQQEHAGPVYILIISHVYFH